MSTPSAKKVIVYSTPTCHFCHMAKDYFTEKKIAFEEKDVSRDIAAQQEMISKTGQLAVPVIDIDGQISVGFNLAQINKHLGLEGEE